MSPRPTRTLQATRTQPNRHVARRLINCVCVHLVEVWFSILSRKCLKRADFADASVATQQIEGFITTYNTHSAHPFAWKKGVRFYKRLKDKIAARSELPVATRSGLLVAA
jgi:hypothetical protein